MLGKKGLEVYRALAEAQWAKLPPPRPKDKESAGQHVYGRYRLISIMETLARLDGDIDRLIEIKAADLTHAYHFLVIAELCREHHRSEEALGWAERGAKAFPQQTDSRLRAFLSEEYARLKRPEEALRMLWANFEDRPGVQTFTALRTDALNFKVWPQWQERTLALVRGTISAAKAAVRAKPADRWGWQPPQPDHSALVELHLCENDDALAWDEAQNGGCRDMLWLELAKRREKTHPAEIWPVYLAVAEHTVPQGHNQAYDQAARLLKKAKVLAVSLGPEATARWRSEVDRLRAEFKPKRNFLKATATL